MQTLIKPTMFLFNNITKTAQNLQPFFAPVHNLISAMMNLPASGGAG
jgi:hypothetical protein